MKNQYFADRRDLFKYDLLLDLVGAHGGGKLTLIPMLTPDDGSAEGRLTQRDRKCRRERVFEFLREALDTERRNIRYLRNLFEPLGVDLLTYRDDREFTHADRNEYFAAIPNEALAGSVVFFDPDIGLESGDATYRAKRGPEKYLLYKELRGVWGRSSPESVVVVYQHLQKDATKRAGDIERRLQAVSGHLGVAVFGIWEGDLAFLVGARSPNVEGLMRAAIGLHAERHGLTCCEILPSSDTPATVSSVGFRPLVASGASGRPADAPAKRGAEVPTISRFYGIAIRIYRDDHQPAHFHAHYGEFSTKIAIGTLEVLEGKVPRRALALVLEWAMMHRPELRENWERAQRHEPAFQIAPLDGGA